MSDPPARKPSGFQLYPELLGLNKQPDPEQPQTSEGKHGAPPASTGPAPKKPLDASLKFQPNFHRPKPKKGGANQALRVTSKVISNAANQPGMLDQPSAPITLEQVGSGVEDSDKLKAWRMAPGEGEYWDEETRFQRTEQNRKNKERKKKNKLKGIDNSWSYDDIYDPERPNDPHAYKDSDEQYAEIREWKDLLHRRHYEGQQERGEIDVPKLLDVKPAYEIRDEPQRGTAGLPSKMNFAPPASFDNVPPQRMSFAPPPSFDTAPPKPKMSFAPPASFDDPPRQQRNYGDDEEMGFPPAATRPHGQAHRPQPPAFVSSTPQPAPPAGPENPALAKARAQIEAMKAKAAGMRPTKPQEGKPVNLQNQNNLWITETQSPPPTIHPAPVQFTTQQPPSPPRQPTDPTKVATKQPTDPNRTTIERGPVYYDRSNDLSSAVPSHQAPQNEAPVRSNRPGQAGFAERYIKKHGWKEGDSLGANNDGITTPLQVHAKKRKKLSDAKGGGWSTPANMGTIGGGKRRKIETTSDDDGKFGDMSEVVKFDASMLSGLDIDYEMQEGNLMQSIGDEMGNKYGTIERLFIWREAMGGHEEVFVKFISKLSALRAVNATDGMMFAGNPVVARFYPAEKFEDGVYE